MPVHGYHYFGSSSVFQYTRVRCMLSRCLWPGISALPGLFGRVDSQQGPQKEGDDHLLGNCCGFSAGDDSRQFGSGLEIGEM